MNIMFWIGLIVLVLGIGSLFVPIPRNEKAGIQVGGVSIGVETRHSEKVSPIVSGMLILAGAGMMIVGKKGSK